MQRAKASRFLGHAALLSTLGALVYAGSLGSGFHFDDLTNIVNNPLIRDMKNFLPGSGAATADQLGLFGRRTVGYFTFALNYHINGVDTRGYHIINNCIHIINAFLVYSLTVLAFRTPLLQGTTTEPNVRWAALFASVLFAVHPIQTQAVTYIVQRFTSLATMFYTGSLAAYTWSRTFREGRKKRTWYFVSLVLCILGMNTKGIVFTLPLALIMWEAMFFYGPWKRRLVLLLPFVLTMSIVPIGAILFHDSGSGGIITVFNIPLYHYLLTESRVLITYIRLLFLPVGQTLDYDYPVFTSLAAGPVLISLTILVVLFSCGLYLSVRAKRNRSAPAALAGIGILWFFLTLSVESTLVPLHPIYEHRLYLPTVGMCMAFGTCIIVLLGRFHRPARRLVLVFCLALVLVLGALAYERNRVWRNEITLWSDVTRKAPNNARDFVSLGSAYYKYGLRAEALHAYNRAYTLFFPFLRQFRTASPAEHARRIKAKGPYARQAKDYAMLQYNLGLLEAVSEKPRKAILRYKEALRAEPSYSNASNNLTQIYYHLGRYDAARNTVGQALTYSPDDQELKGLLKQIEAAMRERH